MKNDLEKRFETFGQNHLGSEAIDKLEIPLGKRDHKRADYLFSYRNIICEVKTLKISPEQKVHDNIDELQKREDFPFFLGAVELDKLLINLPDKKKIKQKLFQKVTRSIEEGFRSANSQIKDTKEIFDLKQSSGLLVILSDVVSFFTPELLANKVSQMLAIKLDNELRYSHVTSVWLILETHSSTEIMQSIAMPSIIIEGPNCCQYTQLKEQYNDLQQGWAKFNNHKLIQLKQERVTDDKFEKVEQRKPLTELSNQELWRQAYWQNPFLKILSDQQLMYNCAQYMNKIKPYFLKGGPKPGKKEFEEFGFNFTCYIEEMCHRGLDWRGVTKYLK